MLPDRVDLEPVARLPLDRRARRPQVAAIHALLGEAVVIKSVAFGHRPRNADGKIVGQRHVEHPAKPARFIAPGFALHLALEIIGWQRGDDVDHPGGRIAAI